MSNKQHHIAIIDPAVQCPELDSFNNMLFFSNTPLSYHLPALYGFDSLYAHADTIVGIVVMGSSASVNDPSVWRDTLITFLKEKWEKKTPTLGICFGHQLIAHIFGSTIIRLKERQIGTRKTTLTNTHLTHEQSEGPLIVSHYEYVQNVPHNFTITAKSEGFPLDGLRHQTLPLWSFQSHPEATSFFNDIRALNCHSTLDACVFGNNIIKSFFNFVESHLQSNE